MVNIHKLFMLQILFFYRLQWSNICILARRIIFTDFAGNFPGWDDIGLGIVLIIMLLCIYRISKQTVRQLRERGNVFEYNLYLNGRVGHTNEHVHFLMYIINVFELFQKINKEIWHLGLLMEMLSTDDNRKHNIRWNKPTKTWKTSCLNLDFSI